MQKISIHNSQYPELLREIAQPPPFLYYKGDTACLKQVCVAMVGTRKNSIYGQQCAEKLVYELRGLPITIVSGLAIGIDAIAHRAALKYGLKTVAILAHGLNYLHPAKHRGLAEQIIKEGGALLSEFEAGTPSYKQNFLQRNRIISGLSKAVCIIECPIHSGAMNTANHANDQNRAVYTLPADITRPQAMGPLELIKSNKAMPIASAKEILKDLQFEIGPQIQSQALCHTEEESNIYSLIQANEATNLHLISQKSNLPAGEISRILTILELKGDIKKVFDGYVRNINSTLEF